MPRDKISTRDEYRKSSLRLINPVLPVKCFQLHDGTKKNSVNDLTHAKHLIVQSGRSDESSPKKDC